jgi:hypothetical protein
MKTHILQLEPHDDIVSVRDKMGWGKAGRILIVWPEHGFVLNRRLDLVLLQRHSLALGAQLAVVSRDPDVRYYAPRLGIPVFKTLRQAQSAPWRLPRRFRNAHVENGHTSRPETLPQPTRSPEADRPHSPPPRPTRETRLLHPAARLALFTLGVLSFLSIAAALLPSAEVSLTAETQQQEITIEVQASPETKSVAIAGAVPARPVTVVVEGRDSLAVSGSMQIPDRPATGQALFTNLTDRGVDIPEGLVVRTSEPQALRFAVTQSGTVSAGPGQTLLLPVRCLTLGKAGNLPAGSLVAIEGLLGTQLSATNPQSTRSGADRQEPAPTEADRRKLGAQLREALQDTARQELQANLSQDDLLVDSSIRLQKVLEETFQPIDIAPADKLYLNLRAEFLALGISGEDLRTLAQSVLDVNLPSGYDAVAESLEIQALTAPVLEGGVARWKLHAQRRIQVHLSAQHVIQLSLGLPLPQASQRLLASLPLAEPPQITLTPSWWPRLPILPFRITVR